MKKTIVCLIGPTAAGKTEVALRLAKVINAEIISCDSMQVYKGIDIATSKPTKKQRKSVFHHLIDIINPSQEYNAARFRVSVLKIIANIHKRGKLPLIVGGCGLYLRALLDGLFLGPGQNLGQRRKFSQQAKRYGIVYLYKRLKDLDPQASRDIHPHDLRRIIRALEVYESTGKPISRLKKKTSGIRDKYDLHLFGLQRPRNKLYSRIEKRVDKMFRRGLVGEIKKLSKRKLSKTATSLLGYKEISGFLKGKYSCNEARDLLKKNTRRYAKRQISWFKREKDVKWIEIEPQDAAETVAEKILQELAGVGDWKR
jgi:tRNA dimethylallyltransferase